MKVFHVDWLSRRHQFSSIPYYPAADRTVSPTRIMLLVCLLCKNNYCTLSVMGYIWKTSCDESWKNMSPGVNDAYSIFINDFCFLPSSEGLLPYVHAPFFWMLLHPLWDLSVYTIHCFLYCGIFPLQSFQVMWSRFLRVFCLSVYLSPSSSPVFPSCANISWLLKPWDWNFLLEL